MRRVLIIAANARTGRDPEWGRRQRPPGVIDVPGLVTAGPMGNDSFKTGPLLAGHFTRLTLDGENYPPRPPSWTPPSW